MNIKSLGLIWATMFIFSECTSEKCNSEVTFTALDTEVGCDSIFTQSLDDEWRTYEPINLNDFDIALLQDQTYCIEFIERPDAFTSCLFADAIEIISIEK